MWNGEPYRVCISATLVGDVKLFPTVAVQIMFPQYFVYTSIVGLFDVSLFDGCLKIFCISFDFCSMILAFQKVCICISGTDINTHIHTFGSGNNNIGDIFVFIFQATEANVLLGNYSIFL